jgi:putative transposase
MRRAGTLVKPKDWKPRKDGKPFGWPRFKSKFRSTPAFGLANNGGISVEGHWAKIQRCPGLVNMAEPLRFDGKIMSGRVSMDATGKWYLAIQVDTDDDDAVDHPVKEPVGVHLGIRQMAITTNDDYYENPRPLERHLRKLAREQRSLKRKQKGSANYEKQRLKVAKLHKRIANIRREAQHKMTHELTAKYAHLRIQQWDIKGMMQEGPFARGLSDVGDYEIRRQLEYKSQWRGGTLDLVDGDVAISQICSACQHRNNVPLSKKTWVCTECGVTHDREENAAINTLNA